MPQELFGEGGIVFLNESNYPLVQETKSPKENISHLEAVINDVQMKMTTARSAVSKNEIKLAGETKSKIASVSGKKEKSVISKQARADKSKRSAAVKNKEKKSASCSSVFDHNFKKSIAIRILPFLTSYLLKEMIVNPSDEKSFSILHSPF